MKERLIQCEYYICENECRLGKKECRFWKEMQKCVFYKKKVGAKPIKTDNRRTKLEKINKKERGDYDD